MLRAWSRLPTRLGVVSGLPDGASLLQLASFATNHTPTEEPHAASSGEGVLASAASDGKRQEDAAMETTKALRAHAFLTGDLEGLKAQQKSAMPYNELIDFMQQRGFTPSAAADVVARLESSGSLLNLHGTILLQPGEVAHALAMVLPSSLSAARQQLEVARQELAALDSQQSKIKRRAIWRHRLFLSGGLSSQILIWGLLFRLTYYELSWDVMEPICFFVGGGQAIMAYTFFMMTRSEFSWEKALDRYVGKWEATQLERAAFDVQRYTFLRAECSRLEDVVRAAERAELEAADRVKDVAKEAAAHQMQATTTS